jgi:hypothetical protein
MSPCCETTTSSGQECYNPVQLSLMHCFVDQLNEKQRRLFLGLEASRLGHGGRKLLVEEFSTSFSVIRQGERELRDPEQLPGAQRVRHPAGRKRIEEQQPEVLEALNTIMNGHIAGDPMNPDVRWTDLRLRQIRDALAEQGFELGVRTVARLVKKTSRSRSRSRKRR